MDIRDYEKPIEQEKEYDFEAGNAEGIEMHKEASQGIGGWLILLALGRILMPVLLIVSIIQSLNALNQIQNNVQDPLSEMWRRLILFETSGNIIILICEVILIFLLFGKKRLFPKAFICYALLAIIMSVANGLLSYEVLSSININPFNNLTRIIITSTIWITYILKSVRVKNTFVN